METWKLRNTILVVFISVYRWFQANQNFCEDFLNSIKNKIYSVDVIDTVFLNGPADKQEPNLELLFSVSLFVMIKMHYILGLKYYEF